LPWLNDAADAFVNHLAVLGFVARASLSQRLTLLVREAGPSALFETLESEGLHAASDLRWTGADLGLWRTLGLQLARTGGSATASVFTLDLPFDALASKTPLDRFAELYTELTGEPPHSELIAAQFGDLTFADQRTAPEGTAIVRATTRPSWRAALTHLVRHYISQGFAAEEIAVVYSSAESAREAVQELEGQSLPVWASGLCEPSVVLERVYGLLDTVRADRAEDLALLVRETLSASDLQPTLPSVFDRAEHPHVERMQLRAIAREQDARRAVDTGLAEVEEAISILGSATLSFDSVVLALRAALVRTAKATVGSRVGAIRVLPIEAASPAKVVIVIDAQRDQFPPRPPRTGGSQLSQQGHLIEEATRWATVLRAFESAEAVVFVLATQGNDGSPAEPSQAITWLERNGASVRTAAAAAPQSMSPNLRRVARENARVASFFSEATPEPPQDPQRWSRRVARSTGAYPAAPMRVTLLEPLLECAFAGFASAVLRARRREEARSDLDALEIGRLQHAALEAAFVATRREWSARPRDGAQIMAVGVSAARQWLTNEIGPQAAVTVDRIAEDCGRLIQESVSDLDWDFALAEQPFDGHVWATHVLGRGDDKVHLSGRIDRIDTHHTEARLRVVDYKGSTSGADAARRRPLQLLVYANVAKRELGLPRAEGLYWPVRARKALDKKGINLDDEALLAKALEATLSLRRHLPLANGSPAACDTCSYDVACRKPRYVVTGLLDDTGES
jgi:RecB family exonuclease